MRWKLIGDTTLDNGAHGTLKEPHMTRLVFAHDFLILRFHDKQADS